MELTITTFTLPVITSNFEALKAQMLEGVKKYDVGVTEDNLADAKKMATELNQLSQIINKVKSEKIKEISGPIEEFKAQVAELVDIAQKSREKLQEQIKKFEDVTRAKVRELVEIEFAQQFTEKAIRKEFQAHNADDFVKVSALTGKGQLNKATKDSISGKVAEARSLQDKIDMRLMQLENAGLKAGLKSPLRKEHVEAFLMLPDDQYEIQLSNLIGIEVQRQTETAAKIQNERPMRYFTCAVCHHVISEYDMPQQCPKCPCKAFQEHSSLTDARQCLPHSTSSPGPSLPPPMPIVPPPVVPVVPVPTWNQERLHQLRGHFGDELFFQMFKIVYQPISDRAIEEAASRANPELQIHNALEWAKGTN